MHPPLPQLTVIGYLATLTTSRYLAVGRNASSATAMPDFRGRIYGYS
jgi:hypothetical protein